MSSQKTGNLGLHIWVPDDYVQMEEFNENFEKLDRVGSTADQLAGEIESITEELTQTVKIEEYQEEIGSITTELSKASQQLEGLEVNVTTVGVRPNDEVDYTAQLRQLIATGVIPVFPSGRYKISDELLFKHGQGIRCVGKVIFDGTDFVGTNGNSVIKVTNNGGNYTMLPSITSNILKGDQQLTFSTEHGLSVGDIICLYDKTDSSWSSARTYYKKSEFCKVASVISKTAVLLDGAFFDSYDATTNANFGVYKINMGTFNIIGDLEIIQGKQGNYYGVIIERVKDFNVENLISIAKNGSYTGISLSQCFNINAKLTGIQEKLSGLSGDYGLAINNCQHVTIDGYFSGSRHGVTTGSYDGIGCVINRDIKVKGTLKTTRAGAAQALGLHGNIETFSFDGVCFGGMAIAGANTKIKGVVYGDIIGNCVQFSELKSFNHDLSGLTCISDGNPTPRGIIDLGGVSTTEVNNALGGTLDLSKVNIDAPNATIGVTVRTRNLNVSDANRSIDLSGAKIKTATSTGTLAYNIRDSSGVKNFDRVDATGVIYNAVNRTVINTNTIHLEKLKGISSFTTVASANFADVSVVYEKPYPSGYIPSINVNLKIAIIGTNEILARVVASTETGFTVRISTLNGLNFNSAVTNSVYWVTQ